MEGREPLNVVTQIRHVSCGESFIWMVERRYASGVAGTGEGTHG